MANQKATYSTPFRSNAVRSFSTTATQHKFGHGCSRTTVKLVAIVK
jgi:hypothetical protein